MFALTYIFDKHRNHDHRVYQWDRHVDSIAATQKTHNII